MNFVDGFQIDSLVSPNISAVAASGHTNVTRDRQSCHDIIKIRSRFETSLALWAVSQERKMSVPNACNFQLKSLCSLSNDSTWIMHLKQVWATTAILSAEAFLSAVIAHKPSNVNPRQILNNKAANMSSRTRPRWSIPVPKSSEEINYCRQKEYSQHDIFSHVLLDLQRLPNWLLNLSNFFSFLYYLSLAKWSAIMQWLSVYIIVKNKILSLNHEIKYIHTYRSIQRRKANLNYRD